MVYQKTLDTLGKPKLTKMFQRLLEIREFEERIRFLFLEGKMPGTVHQYIGMEACAVGVCSALKKDDVIASTHRPHGHALARDISMEAIMGELYGKTTGCCRGKGGSMHVGDLSKGMVPAIAIVGANIPIVMGMGLAFKLRKEPRVAVSFFGDGASNEGAFHEGLNMAAVYGVPAVFICENNQYGASTSVNRVLKLENIADRAAAYGMRGDIANRRDPNNYMSAEEKESWQKKDPLPFFEKILTEKKVLTKDKVAKMKKEVEQSVEKAIESGQQGPQPDPEEVFSGFRVRPARSTTGSRRGVQRILRHDGGAEMILGIAEALRKAIHDEMERDPAVFCIGEDIGIPGGYGGAFTVTLGLEKDFRERIIDTPISEAGIFGAACGAALMGMRPIADVQYGDFLLCAMDQIVDQIAKLRYMSGGKLKVPVVMRAPVGVTRTGSAALAKP
jgi:TPP-dependent pyruvate/acetoin dehydrogenase alpha subunit